MAAGGGEQFFSEVADEDVDSVAFVEAGYVRGAEPEDYGCGKNRRGDDERNLPTAAFFL